VTLVFIKKMGPSKNCASGPLKALSGTDRQDGRVNQRLSLKW